MIAGHLTAGTIVVLESTTLQQLRAYKAKF